MRPGGLIWRLVLRCARTSPRVLALFAKTCIKFGLGPKVIAISDESNFSFPKHSDKSGALGHVAHKLHIPLFETFHTQGGKVFKNRQTGSVENPRLVALGVMDLWTTSRLVLRFT